MLHKRSGPASAHLKIGLLGGSFNPAHEGHRAMSLHALRKLGLDQVWWLVSPQNPLKPVADMAPLEQRLAEAEKLANHPRIIVTDLERQLGTRYTVETLRALRKRFSRTRFVWLMGADNLKQIPRWHDWADIFRLVPVAVFKRPAYAAGRGRGKATQLFGHGWKPGSIGKKTLWQKPPVWMVFDNRLSDVSATDIRKGRTTWPK